MSECIQRTDPILWIPTIVQWGEIKRSLSVTFRPHLPGLPPFQNSAISLQVPRVQSTECNAQDVQSWSSAYQQKHYVVKEKNTGFGARSLILQLLKLSRLGKFLNGAKILFAHLVNTRMNLS